MGITKFALAFINLPTGLKYKKMTKKELRNKIFSLIFDYYGVNIFMGIMLLIFVDYNSSIEIQVQQYINASRIYCFVMLVVILTPTVFRAIKYKDNNYTKQVIIYVTIIICISLLLFIYPILMILSLKYTY